MLGITTLRVTRRNLPHWEIEAGRYFVTVRCADSLPREAATRIEEIHKALRAVEPRSEEFAVLQRRYFLTIERYLSRGSGSCLLARYECARSVAAEFEALSEWRIEVPHFSVMPNHWHALLVFPERSQHTLGEVLKRVKGRSGHAIRRFAGGNGQVWQREWFDHWIRSDAEWDRCVAYVRANPVKAGLIRRWQDHPWTR